MNQHHDAFHPGMLSVGNGILLPIAAIMTVGPAGAAQAVRDGKLQDVAMLGAANVTEGEKQRGLLKKSIGLWEISRDEKTLNSQAAYKLRSSPEPTWMKTKALEFVTLTEEEDDGKY
ncbi:hypothetical protein [Pseudomonas syringae group sp. 247E2]|uniref:hypothetical protein n=1 Tax=Pseudomonas syringae group sp. 247E2 TaxID=3079592 RepID=UPI00290FCED0|nr:hypothetical protein [Pseudomonas syringae group sp. 247E2]MDU8606937.1 hypothetical protein [Pseudomonas syringae group sp. 247E2]